MSSIKLILLLINLFLFTILITIQIFLNHKIKKTIKNNKKNNKVNKKNIIIVVILIILLILSLIYYVYQVNHQKKEEILKKEQRSKDYNTCLIEPYNNLDNTDNINNKINEINKYIQNNYYASIIYEDINTGFTYKYNSEKVYYGASLIKLVAAMYLIDKDSKQEENIDSKTLKYTYQCVADYSTGMKTKKIYDDVTLKELISYAITYSDNSAYCMLINYIGEYNLINYAKSLGAAIISITKDEQFGPQNAIDTNIYLHHAYEIINNNKKYGQFLKDIMLNNDTNALNLTDDVITAAHKYGMYDYVYHDIGIIYGQYPYYISILTNHGRNNYIKIVNDIHSKVNELHNLFYQERKNRCYKQVYTDLENVK